MFVFVGECVVIVMYRYGIDWVATLCLCQKSYRLDFAEEDSSLGHHISSVNSWVNIHTATTIRGKLAPPYSSLMLYVILVTIDDQWITESPVLLNPLHSVDFYICLITPYLFGASSKLPCTFKILLILLVYPCMTAICNGELSSWSLQ